MRIEYEDRYYEVSNAHKGNEYFGEFGDGARSLGYQKSADQCNGATAKYGWQTENALHRFGYGVRLYHTSHTHCI